MSRQKRPRSDDRDVEIDDDDIDENWVLSRLKDSGEFDRLRERVAAALDLNCNEMRAHFESRWVEDTIVRQKRRPDAPLPTWKEFAVASWSSIESMIQAQIRSATWNSKEMHERIGDTVRQILVAAVEPPASDGPTTLDDETPAETARPGSADDESTSTSESTTSKRARSTPSQATAAQPAQ